MGARVLLVLAVAAAVYVLAEVDVTLPALSVLGLVAWALFSTVLAVLAYRRHDHPTNPYPSRKADKS